jgi:hypothetical protein
MDRFTDPRDLVPGPVRYVVEAVIGIGGGIGETIGDVDGVDDALALALGGSTWPDGDEDRLAELSRDFNALASVLADGMEPMVTHSSTIAAAYGGQSGAEFIEGANLQLGFGGEGGAFPALNEAVLRSQSAMLGAIETQNARATVVTQALVTAISVMAATISSLLLPPARVSVGGLFASGRPAAGGGVY